MQIKEKINTILSKGGTYTAADLTKRLGLTKGDITLVERTLKGMKELMNQRGRYGLPAAYGCYEGTVQGTNGDYCFVLCKEKDDLFIPPGANMGALHGDTVLARSVKTNAKNHKTEGEIIKVLHHANEFLVGELVMDGARAYVLPSGRRINRTVHIKNLPEGAKSHQQVVCKVTGFPQSGPLQGKITEILGFKEEKGVDILSIIKEHNLPDVFPAQVLAEAENISAMTVEPNGRADLRNEVVFTIDGEDAKDLDDAISIKPEGKGWCLGVHIADVTHYVRPGSPLDTEAEKRGTSVYFPGRVLPMLPPALSNGICSLNPNEDRLTLTALMHINDQGTTTACEIFPSIIRSRHRLNYRQVAAFLRGETVEALNGILEELQNAEALFKVLKAKRTKRGSVDFDLAEPHFTLDENGKAINVEPALRETSNEMIEQFMLEANECVAAFMQSNSLPAMYRVHEEPDTSRIADLNELLAVFGYHLSDVKTTPAECAALINKVAGKNEELLVSRMLLRSMKKARYSEENLGHFGLAAQNYLHFTSPIRRYPDLIVHRMIHFFLDKNTSGLAKYKKHMHDLSTACSDREVTAVEAERAADDLKRAEYAQKLVGQSFEGVISGMSTNAMWVELPSTVECIIPLATLQDDYYAFTKNLCSMIGERTRKVYRFGDRVQVQISAVSLEQKRVEATIIKKL